MKRSSLKMGHLPIALLLIPISPVQLAAQAATDTNSAALAQILDRLSVLEKQNRELADEVHSLRSELASAKSAQSAPPPSLDDRVAVAESRIDEQAQTKVEAAHKFPVSLTGLLLFNAFANSKGATSLGVPSFLTSTRSGATLSQSLLGFDFNGPELPANGRITGSLNLDFYGGISTFNYDLHIRRGVVNFIWKDREVTVGQEKPLISARQPDSLAEVTYPPLADVGNPWLWVPQVRYTERVHFSNDAGVDAQAAFLATSERSTYKPNLFSVAAVRPAWEARANIWTRRGDTRFEIAPGVHVSDSRVNGISVPSRFGSVDWLIKPASWVQITGLLIGGENTSVFGGFPNSFAFARGLNYSQPYRLVPVHDIGGWTQFSFPLSSRLTFNAFGGFTAPRTAGLPAGSVTHSSAVAGNLIYRLAPNVLLAFETMEERYGYLDKNHAIGKRYDLALGYLF